MATRPRSARKKKGVTENQANLDPIVLPDLSRPPRIRRSPSASMAAASAPASGSGSSAATISSPTAVSHPSTTSSTPATSAPTSVATSSVLATPPPPDSTSTPTVSVSQPSVPLPVRPPLGDFYSPHHINRQHYERFTKLDKKLISIGAIVENDCVAIDSLIEHFRYQEWDKYIQMKGIGYPYVLKCFYANISSENYSFPLKSYFTKDVIIDTDTLSRTFNIPNSGVDVFDKTLKDFEGYIDGDTKETAMSMIFKEGETDLDCPAPQQMRLLPQCLARIISLNIAPTLSRSTIYKWTPVLVYCLLKKIKVNLPRLLLQTMYYCVQQPKLCLPFGKVLTKLFQLENISLDAYPSMESRPPFHKKNLGQMLYKGYSLPITMDSVPSHVQKKDMEDVSNSRQAEAPASPHPETHSPIVQAEASIPSPPPPTHSEAQAPPVVTESTTIPVEPLVTQAEIPSFTSSDAPPAQSVSQAHPSSVDPDQPIFDNDVDDDDDGTHQYSPLRDEDLSPSPPLTSPPTSTIPPPPFSIPPSAKSSCVPPKPTFYFEEDTSMSYDHRWLAHFAKECYYNSVNTMIADSNARAWETHFMMQAGFQALNPSIRLPPPTMHPFIPVPSPSSVMRTHHLLCMQQKSEAIRQKKRAAAMSSSIRPPAPTSSTFTSSSTPSSFPIMTTKPLGSTSTFAPVSISSAFASLSKGLGIRPPTPPDFLTATEIPIRASPEVTLISEVFTEKSTIDFSLFNPEISTSSPSIPVTSSLPQASSSAAPSPAHPATTDAPLKPPATETLPSTETPATSSSVPEATPVSHPAAETTPVPHPTAEATSVPITSQAPETPVSIPAVLVPSAEDSPEGPLRWKRTKMASSHPSRPAKKKKLMVSPPPQSTDASPPPATSSPAPPIPLPFQVAHPTTEELCNFLKSQKKK